MSAVRVTRFESETETPEEKLSRVRRSMLLDGADVQRKRFDAAKSYAESIEAAWREPDRDSK